MAELLTFRMITSMLGVLLLFGWFYATATLTAHHRLFFRSLWLFAAPMLIIILLPNPRLPFLVAVLGLVLVEELIKLNAARWELSSIRKFWMVALFGIWELMLAKPFLGFDSPAELAAVERADLLLIAASGIVPVVMHSVTAAIYAFRLKRKPFLQLTVCWTIHATYNLAVDLSVSLFALAWTIGVGLAVMSLLLFLAWNEESPAETAEVRTVS